MAEFLTELEVKVLHETEGGRSLWQLAHPLVYQSDILKEPVCVSEGFVTDFASVPRIPVVYLLMNDVGQPAAVIHDYLYRFHPCTRAEADAVLEEALKVLGVSWWRRKSMWAAVRLAGWGAYKG